MPRPTSTHAFLLLAALVLSSGKTSAHWGPEPEGVEFKIWHTLPSAPPQDQDHSERMQALTDAGFSWGANSLLHPPYISISQIGGRDPFDWMISHLITTGEFTDSANTGVTLKANVGLELRLQEGLARQYKALAWQPYLWSAGHIRDNFYYRLYIRATNAEPSVPHYSGVARSVSRAGFNTGEVDQGVIGYTNGGLLAEFGRSREIWGPHGVDNLVLSGNSPAYERLLLQFQHKRFRFRYFLGFLESVELEDGYYPRYLIGRAIEYSNHRNLLLGIAETGVITGLNRPLDLAFFNPLALHLEVEQNKRGNYHSQSWANAIWSFYADWLPFKQLRFSGSFAFDEIQLDQADREQGRGDAIAYDLHLAYTPILYPIGLTFFADRTMVGTYTLQHTNGLLNFVTRDELIGHPIGNDADRTEIGARIIGDLGDTRWLGRYAGVLFELAAGQRRWGENSLLSDPYHPYEEFVKVKFPSGIVRTNRYVRLKIDVQLTKYLALGIDGHWDIERTGPDSDLETWTFLLRYNLPLKFEF